jgi:hypothetical protein
LAALAVAALAFAVRWLPLTHLAFLAMAAAMLKRSAGNGHNTELPEESAHPLVGAP